MDKAIFLDRDGVINKERGDYTWKIKDFIFNDGLFSFLKTMQEKGYILIIITNQGGISKGIYSHKDLSELNMFMFNEFSNNAIKITDLYYCPHHSDNEKCLCRKPNSLMLEKAIAKYNINVQKSYFIGDSERDIIAGKKAGLNTIKIEANSNLLNILNKIS